MIISGFRTVVLSRTGAAISERKASGTDAITFAQSNIAISERIGSGADVDDVC